MNAIYKVLVCCYAKCKIEKSMNASTSVSSNFLNIFAKPHDCKVRAVIKFLNAKNVPAAEIYGRICAVYGKQNIMSLHHVYKWVQLFKEGRSEVHDDERTSRPSDALTDDAITAVHALWKKIVAVLFRIYTER